jgi:hypothetical protein
VSGFYVNFNNREFSVSDDDAINVNTVFKYGQRTFNGKLYNDVHYTYTSDRVDTMFYKREKWYSLF